MKRATPLVDLTVELVAGGEAAADHHAVTLLQHDLALRVAYHGPARDLVGGEAGRA